MTDIAVENAQRRIADAAARIHEIESKINALQSERASLQNECERARAFISAWAEFAGVDAEKAPEAQILPQAIPGLEPVEKPPRPQMKRPKNPKKEDVAAKARELILEHGKPMGRTELFKALSDAGVVIRGSNPEMVLSTMLWRMSSQIVRLQPHGYWLADVPNAEVGFDPDTHSVEGDVPDTSSDTSLDDLLG